MTQPLSWWNRPCATAALCVLLSLTLPSWAAGSAGAEGTPVLIGLNADMSTADAESGEAIQLGAEVAIAEINAAGGALGRPLDLVVRDHRRNPARGVEDVIQLAAMDNLVAILGGKHTPVALEQLAVIHQHGVPYLTPWAAGTKIIDHAYAPSFSFRVSVRDEYAGTFLVRHAHAAGYRRLGLLLEQTGWGRSNETALRQALSEYDLEPTGVEWFNWGMQDCHDSLDRLLEAQSDVLIFVGNSPDGVALARTLLDRPIERRLPVISHWGIAGGDFVAPLGPELAQLDLIFLQTFSFIAPPFPDRAERLLQGCRQLRPEIETARDIPAPAGVAHAYDLVHLLVRAIEKAGGFERAAVRDALENIDHHRGVMRDYAPPFTPSRHDALTIADYRMGRFEDGVIVPVTQPEGP